MKASRLVAYGDTSHIKFDDIPQPKPGPGEVLVKVAASGLNHVETYLRLGYLAQMMPLELPATLGIDLAGVVEETGRGVSNFKKGDRVIGRLPINGKGSHADYAVATEGQLARLPDSVGFDEGATLPLVGLTGRQAVDAVGARKGERVLVTGALGSVGRSAVQYLHELGVGVVAAVLPTQLDEAKALGLEAIVLGEGANDRQFEHVIETVGGPVAESAIATVKDGGVIAGTAGFPEGINGDNRVKVVNVFSGDNPSMLQEVADAAGQGKLKLPIVKIFPLDRLAEAYELLATRPAGKIIIRH